MFPLKVLNRLKLGRDVVAEVTCSRPRYQAWVCISPLVPKGQARYQEVPIDAEPLLDTQSQELIEGYSVRYTELDQRYLDPEEDPNLACDDPGTVDRTEVIRSVEQLECAVSQLVDDLSDFRSPPADHPVLPLVRYKYPALPGQHVNEG
jgi:hypothetical protein